MTPPEPGLAVLLHLRGTLIRNGIRSMAGRSWLKIGGLSLFTAGFMVAEGALAFLLLNAIYLNEDLERAFVLQIVQRLLSLVFLVCLSMLFFSNITSSIATLYMSRDLPLLFATPITTARIFALKAFETLVNSSYVVVLFLTPILVALGLVFAAGPIYYLQIPVTVFLFVLPPAAAGMLVTMFLMRFRPAKRTHQIMSAIGLMLAVAFVTMLRVVAPERLLAPTSSEDFRAILSALTVPAAAYLPSTWAANVQLATCDASWSSALRSLLPLASLALFATWLTQAAARSLYAVGVFASQEGGRRGKPSTGVAVKPLSQSGKEMRLFVRDPTQWTQILLLGALVIIYVFNITALPTELMIIGALVTLRDIVAWINVGLAGFVLAATAMRFVLPAISNEGGAFWIIASSPASRRGYVLRKLALTLPPMLGFALILVSLSGYALKIDSFTRDLSLATTVLLTWTITSMAIGLGARFPSFKLENPAQFMLTGGGILYAVLALFYVVAIVALEAKPFFWHLLGQAGVLDVTTVDPVPYYAATLALSAVLSFGSLALGLRHIVRIEL